MSDKPGVGDPAPAIELPRVDGRPFSLAGLRGHPVVVFFFPKASTPG